MKVLSFLYYTLLNPPNNFLKKSKGIIHIGAHTGQERFIYNYCGLNVCWIEPIEEYYIKLKSNIENISKQSCYKELICKTNKDDIKFNISSNEGKSSSIFNLKDHKKMWPEVSMDEVIKLDGISLPTFIDRYKIDIDIYDCLLLDTQGAELEILEGAINTIQKFNYIQVEAADFEAYNSCPGVDDICSFMQENNFNLLEKNKFSEKKSIGSYYDLVFINSAGKV
tara:strand:- start:2272 stop:2943 length:672 start_codon:yes stop_codon:yes gene_type:complete